MTQDNPGPEADETIAAEAVAGEATRADALAREDGTNPKAPVAAGDPRSLVVDRQAEDTASPEAAADEASAEENADKG